MQLSHRRFGLLFSLILTLSALVLASSAPVSGAPVQQAGTVNFTLDPPSPAPLTVGQTVDVDIKFSASASDPVGGAQAFLNFDSTVLQVVDPATGLPATSITPGTMFDPLNENWLVVDNSVGTGTIKLLGGKQTAGPTDDLTTTVTFGTVRFEALAKAPGGSLVEFSTIEPRKTKAVESVTFNDVTGNLTGATVTVINTAPTAVNDTAEVAEGGTVTVVNPPTNNTKLTDNDTDPEGDPLTVTTTPVTPPVNGNVTLNADGTFSYTHNGSETTSDSFVYEACDDGPLCNIATVNIVVNPVNDNPTAVDDDVTTNAGFSTDEDTAIAITPSVLTNDTDAETPLTLSVQSFNTTGGIDGLPTSTLGLVTNNLDGTFGYDPNNQFEALNNLDTATDSFTYTLSDGNGGTAIGTVTITINGVDDPVDVTFDITIQGRPATSTGQFWTMSNITLELYTSGTSTLVTSPTPTTTSSDTDTGSFVANNVPQDTYDIWVKGSNTVAKRVNGVVISAASSNIDLGTLIGGNATDGVGGGPDAVVDGGDYNDFLTIDIVIDDLSVLPLYQRGHDYNFDGLIDIIDYLIIVENFGQVDAAKP